ncbi:helix-turn-helix domain-containing protein [Arenicella xantha]|uniref:AraC family transcriptional regulator n=1 Tax=Arenicella xantha TaxID=644221 RepID=A0A395JP52_9GAMM|nr:helix-turn-helix domain-containing protein [Arenicella xantha]RBP53113.1 AraC family transcriptional regulator [Arenicella xantha]
MDKSRIEKQQLEAELVTALKQAGAACTVDTIEVERFDLNAPQQDLTVRVKTYSRFAAKTKPVNQFNRNSKGSSITVSLVYQNKPIGDIEIVLAEEGMDLVDVKRAFEDIALDFTYFIKRKQAHKKIKDSENLDMQWLGRSRAAKQVDQFIEKSSSVDFPVLIYGEFGSGKLLTAYSIHCHSLRRQGPFVEGRCGKWQDQDIIKNIETLWQQAQGGTLFLRDIDLLPQSQFIKVRNFWLHGTSSTASAIQGVGVPVRVIASVSQKRIEKQRCVWQELDYLSIELPSLRDRRGDIREMTEHYLRKLSHINKVSLSSDCMELLERFDWEDNIQQLERVISKLVLMSDSSHLEPSGLLAIIPQLSDKQGQKIELPEAEFCEQSLTIADIATLIASDSYLGQVTHHPALEKAINYLAEQYSSDLTLSGLAEKAFVSASHLSYLFKHHLDSSFKQLLIQIRIAKAKLLLKEKPTCKITEIAFDVGFHDLSHFEKTFKRVVGISPGKYRRRRR